MERYVRIRSLPEKISTSESVFSWLVLDTESGKVVADCGSNETIAGEIATALNTQAAELAEE